MRARRVSAGSSLATGVLGLTAFAAYLLQPLLGFEDTDDPGLGVAFSREHPSLVEGAGVAFIVLAVAVVIAASSTRQAWGSSQQGWPADSAAVAGYSAGTLLLLFGAMRIGSAGPLTHIADLDQSWGETAYLVMQIAGVQGALPAGLLCLALWATALSAIGWRTGQVSRWVCLLGVIPAVHVLLRVFGNVVPIPGIVWVVGLLSIPGTFVWCLALGAGSLREPGLRDAQRARAAEN